MRCRAEFLRGAAPRARKASSQVSAEYFLDLNRERIMEGLKAALARGRKGGRPKKLSEADLAAARAMQREATIPVAEIAKRLGVSRTAFYSYFPAARSRQTGVA